jgi:adenylate cyclase class 2
MAIETEAKIRLADRDHAAALRARVVEFSGMRVGSRFELNTFFDTADARLRSRGEGLRLRRMRDDATGRSTAVVTFKGPILPGEMKRRDEIECEVADAELATQLLAKLGFDATLSFEKQREIWTLDGCEVVIDELPKLGHFVEIEGSSEAVIRSVIKKLDLSDQPLIKTGYASMITSLSKRS